MNKRFKTSLMICKTNNIDLWGQIIFKGKKKSRVFRRIYYYLCRERFKVRVRFYLHDFLTNPNYKRFKRLSFHQKMIRYRKIFRKFYRNVNERQFFRYYRKAFNCKRNCVFKFLMLLESRLDVIVFRAFMFAITFNQIRQFVSHGFVFVNGKPCTYCGFSLKFGDVITFKLNLSSQIYIYLQYIRSRLFYPFPSYIEVNLKKMIIIFIGLKKPKDISEVVYPGFELNIGVVKNFYNR